MANILKKIFSITNTIDRQHKQLVILGLCIKFKKRKNLNDIEKIINTSKIQIIQRVQRSINTALLHQKTFLPYKNCYQGKDTVIVGAGPTLNNFTPINDCIYIGCNRVFLFDKVKFDYLFTIDKVGIDKYYEGFLQYEGNNCVKFIGDQNLGENFQIPESYILHFPQDKIRRYKTVSGYLPDKFELDIDSMPLANGASVTLQAAQFALYTNPRRIYIVGVDCTVAQKQHFAGSSYDNKERGESAKFCDNYNISMWKKLKEFASLYYPETEIISVNPVGLKGIFRDLYTENYIDEHPELKTEGVEILKGA